jgi:hypothetical protein
MIQLELKEAFRSSSVLVNGMRSKLGKSQIEVEYLGRATQEWDGTWRCYALIDGCLCIVEVSIIFAPESQ